jgi:DNA-binding XRE family transcriptional regulator
VHKCSSCDGTGKATALLCPAGEVREVKCFTCGGSGVLSDERLWWMHNGKALRELRQAHGLGQMEAAKRFGVPVHLWSNAEHGRIDPAPYLEMATGGLRP